MKRVKYTSTVIKLNGWCGLVGLGCTTMQIIVYVCVCVVVLLNTYIILEWVVNGSVHRAYKFIFYKNVCVCFDGTKQKKYYMLIIKEGN